MALPKLLLCAVVLLVIFYSLDKQGFRHSVALEDVLGVEASKLHAREKRASTNAYDYTFQAAISLSDLESFHMILSNLSFPITINNTEITSIDPTTVCSSNNSVFQCLCEENFSWSYNNCITYGVCDAIISNTCGCIKNLPADGLFCQENTSQLVPVDIDVILELNIPVISVVSNYTEIQNKLNNMGLPRNISQSLQLLDANVTTVCSPASTQLQCHCEDSFAWPCDMCVNNSCSQVTGQTCSCVTGLPANQFCQPITSSLYCLNPATTTLLTTIQPSLTVLNTMTVTLGAVAVKNDTFKMSLTFNNSFNEKTSPVYNDVLSAINKSCCESVSKSCLVQQLSFRSGSTIVDYTLSAPSINDAQSQQVKIGVFSDLKSKNYSMEIVICFNETFGNRTEGAVGVAPCEGDMRGEITARCMSTGSYGNEQNNCILPDFKTLLDASENLSDSTLPVFLESLKNVTVNNTKTITESPANIKAIVKIFNNVANVNLSLSEDSMKNILETAGILTINDAYNSWKILNDNDTQYGLSSISNNDVNSTSSLFLSSFETITSFIVDEILNIETSHIQLNKTTFTSTSIQFNVFNSSVEIDIPAEDDEGNESITVILFSSMDNVLPTRDEDNSTSSTINGKIALIHLESNIENISLKFDIMNKSLKNPRCVFWDFSLSHGLGEWSDYGCFLVSYENESVSCRCNHTTSFSILMSPDTSSMSSDPISIPVSSSMSSDPHDALIIIITCIGLGISIGSLVICLFFEAIIWHKIEKNTTSHLRHISMVNIAACLLIANIIFLIQAAISDEKKECTAATFFMHFFYLAMFFWMLNSALLLLYCTTKVFYGGLCQNSMLAIGFSLGYGAPLLIATVTIAVTAPSNEYLRETNVCWLNWNKSKALLAFVVPALLIVLINVLILLVVLYKMLKRNVGRNAGQPDERHFLMVIARSLAVLTPFLGLSWGLGIGTMIFPESRRIQIIFALCNSTQGFFIFVFGTLLDKKVRLEIVNVFTSQGGTRSTGSLEYLLWKFRNARGAANKYKLTSEGSKASKNI